MKKLLIAVVLFIAGSANAMSTGRFENKSGDGSTDILIINQNGSVSLETTRQVGGPGGLSNEGVVPYETVCRVKEWATIYFEDAERIDYQVKFAHLTDQTGLLHTEHCERFIGELNGRAMTGQVRYSTYKADYTQTK